MEKETRERASGGWGAGEGVVRYLLSDTDVVLQ